MNSILPLEIEEKEDSWELLQLLSNVETKFKLTATEFNKIVEAINFLGSFTDAGNTAAVIEGKLDRGGYEGTAQDIIDIINEIVQITPITKALRKHPSNDSVQNKNIPQVNDWMIGYFLTDGTLVLRGQLTSINDINLITSYNDDTLETA